MVNEITSEDPWDISFKQGLFNMTSDSHLFRTRRELEDSGLTLYGSIFIDSSSKNEEEWLPLYEAKMIHQFDHRFGTYEGQTQAQANQGKLPELSESQHANPSLCSLSRYWVSKSSIASKPLGWGYNWLIGFRDITSSVVLRTVIVSLLPRVGVGNKVPLFISDYHKPQLLPCFIANCNSIVFDYIARQKIGGTTLNFYIVKQLPILPPTYCLEHILHIFPRILELLYTSWDIKHFADDMWRETDEEHRASIHSQWEASKEDIGSHTWDPPEWAEIADNGIPLPHSNGTMSDAPSSAPN